VICEVADDGDGGGEYVKIISMLNNDALGYLLL